MAFAIILSATIQPAKAQSAEDTVMFLVTGLQDGTRLGNNNSGAAKQIGNGVVRLEFPKPADSSYWGEVRILSVKQVRQCEFEFSVGTAAAGEVSPFFITDFNKFWEAKWFEFKGHISGASIICLTRGRDRACHDKTRDAIEPAVADENRSRKAAQYFRETYFKGRAF